MKEILYIQAGNFSNYIGTHFWNTQESYLSDEDSNIDAQVSFRNAPQDYQTMCPRLLMFDWKDNFGPLNRTNAMGSSDQGTSETGLWTGNVQEIRQTPIPRSAYHQHMFDGGVDSLENPPKSDGSLEETVRCWSDYSRVYYTPDTIQQVPGPSDREDPNGNWGVGVDSFKHYEKESDLMEGSVRLSLEECDTLQGLQVINDCDSFGGFTASFLTSFKDDYGKATTLAFAVLSGNEIAGDRFDMSNDKKTQATMTDALYLRALHELASSSVPIQPPSQWSSNHWPDVQSGKSLKMNPYYSSAIASAHIESSTLPLRLGHETLPSFSAKLNWQTANTFGELLGTFHLTSVSDERLRDLTNFTWPHPSTNVKVARYIRLEVTRGLSDSDLRIYDAYYSNLTSSRSITRFNALAYPLPSSFPSTLWPEDMIQPRSSRDSLPTIKCISSLSGSDAISPLFKAYAAFAEECLRRKNAAALSVGLDVDELRELVHDLWTIYDNYKHDDDVDSHGSE